MRTGWCHKESDGKRYCYYLLSKEFEEDQADWQEYTWCPPPVEGYPASYTLDVHAMDRVANQLVGVHDFRELSSIKHTDKSSIRHLKHASVRLLPKQEFPFLGELQPPEGNSLIQISLEGEGFLKHMVRRVTGLLVRVGQGFETGEGLSDAISAEPGPETPFSRKKAPVAPAKGLWLEEVFF